MGDSSNIDEVSEWLDELIGTINFKVDIGSATLGEDIRDLVALMISRRSANLQKGADEHWKPLRDWYLAWKRKNFGVEKIGVLTGQMLSLASLRGQTTIRGDRP